MKQTITLRTDESGRIRVEHHFDPPVLRRDRTIEIAIEVVSPSGIEIVGTLDIDAGDGAPTNTARNFNVKAGRRAELGRWRIDKDDNVVVLRGETRPPRPDHDIVVELDAELVPG